MKYAIHCTILGLLAASAACSSNSTPVSPSGTGVAGVAAVPETSTSPSDVIPMADAALYGAKQAGKNCVRAAERRSGREDAQPRLAVG